MNSWREKRHILWIVVLIILYTGLAVSNLAWSASRESSPTSPSAWPKKLTLAILPYQVPPHIYDIWSPVADYLLEHIGIPVQVTTSNVYEEYVPTVLATRPEIAFLNALQYLTAHREAGYEAFIAPTKQMIGRIIVRVDSPIQTIAELRGKRLSFLPPSAMPGHLQPKALLLDHDMVAGEDYTIVEVANHNLSINAVVAGKVDAGVTGVMPFETLPPGTKSQLRILAETPPQPPVVIAIRGDVDPALRELLAEHFLKLNTSKDGRAILAPLGWKAVMRVTDTDYDAPRRFAKKFNLKY